MYYYHSKPEEGTNRITVAGQWNNGILDLAIAKCSKRDQFKKEMGRTISQSRLFKGKIYKSVLVDQFTGKVFVEAARAVAKEAGNSAIAMHS